MKVAFVIDDSLDRPDGVQQYIITLGQWLTVQGHEAIYLCSTTNRDDINSYHSVAKNIGISYNKNRLRIPLPANKSKIHDVLSSFQPDIVHIQLPHSPMLGGKVIKAANNMNIPVLGTFHIAPYARAERFGLWLMRPYYQRVAKRIDEIIAVSPAAQSCARQTFRTDIRVIPNGVTIDRFESSRPEATTKTIEVRFLGRLVPRKGAIFALQAFHEAQKRSNAALHLTIAGRGPQLTQLKTYVDKHQLQDHVAVVGFIAENNKASFLAGADIIVLPSIGGESFGISVVEAMATPNVAVIAGDNPGYRHVIDDESMLIDPHNINTFADKINELANNDLQRKEIAKRQSRRAKIFDISLVGDQILSLYERLTNQEDGQS